MHCGGDDVSPEPIYRCRYVEEEGELPYQGVPDAIPRCGWVDGEELGTYCGEEPVPVGHCEYGLEGMNEGVFVL